MNSGTVAPIIFFVSIVIVAIALTLIGGGSMDEVGDYFKNLFK